MRYSCMMSWLMACALGTGTGTSAGAGEATPFDPPIGGWPASPAVGSINTVRAEGLDGISRAWFNLGIPDGTGGGPVYTRTKAWPVVIVLHGSGNTGADMSSVFRAGLKELGAIGIFPTTLINNPLLEWNYPYEMYYVQHLIRQVAATYRIDPRRIYLAGHSMGGGGTYQMGSILREQWAALGPMAGYWQYSPGVSATRLKNLPVRILHGTNDANVPIAQGDAAYSAITGAGNSDVFYDKVSGGTHSGILTSGPHARNMAVWLLARKRSTVADFVKAESDADAYGLSNGFEWRSGLTPIGHGDPAPAGNVSPIITAGPTASSLNTTVGATVTFSCNASDADVDDSVFFSWSFGDGTSSWLRNPTHVFRHPGTYTVRLTVRDDYAHQVQSSLIVTVTGSGALPSMAASDSASGVINQPFSKNILASGAAHYHAIGLPPGLYLDTATGAITGTPEIAGVYTVAVRAFSTAGLVSQTMTITITSVGGAPEADVMRGTTAIADASTDSITGTIVATATTLTYAFKNLGTTDLNVGAVAAANFSGCTVAISTQPSTVLAANASSNLVLTVTPSSAGAWSFTLSSVTNDSDENPYNWTVSGVAGAPPPPPPPPAPSNIATLNYQLSGPAPLSNLSSVSILTGSATVPAVISGPIWTATIPASATTVTVRMLATDGSVKSRQFILTR